MVEREKSFLFFSKNVTDFCWSKVRKQAEEGALNQNFMWLENYNMKRNDDTKESKKKRHSQPYQTDFCHQKKLWKT